MSDSRCALCVYVQDGELELKALMMELKYGDQESATEIMISEPDEVFVTLAVERFVFGTVANLAFEKGDVELTVDWW